MTYDDQVLVKFETTGINMGDFRYSNPACLQDLGWRLNLRTQ